MTSRGAIALPLALALGLVGGTYVGVLLPAQTTTSSSSTTSTTGTTTTTTTSTTTTTLAGTPSAMTPFFGGVPQANMSTDPWGGANVLHCTVRAPTESMTDIAELWVRTGSDSSGQSGTLGVGIYSADGSTLEASGTQTYSTSNELIVVSLTPTTFDLVAGTEYQWCFCSSSGNGTYVTVDGNLGSTVPAALENIFIPRHGTATNSCTGTAAVPATTGGIASTGTWSHPWIMVGP